MVFRLQVDNEFDVDSPWPQKQLWDGKSDFCDGKYILHTSSEWLSSVNGESVLDSTAENELRCYTGALKEHFHKNVNSGQCNHVDIVPNISRHMGMNCSEKSEVSTPNTCKIADISLSRSQSSAFTQSKNSSKKSLYQKYMEKESIRALEFLSSCNTEIEDEISRLELELHAFRNLKLEQDDEIEELRKYARQQMCPDPTPIPAIPEIPRSEEKSAWRGGGWRKAPPPANLSSVRKVGRGKRW